MLKSIYSLLTIKKTITPDTKRIIPANKRIILLFLSSGENLFQGFCFAPITAIIIVMANIGKSQIGNLID